MREIELHNGMKAIVDDEDFESLNKIKWQAVGSRSKYAAILVKFGRKGARSHTALYMHKVIMGCPDAQVDHINGNPLDNRKQNLRLCTAKQNAANRRGFASSGYKGVDKIGKIWRARIYIDGKSVILGRFATIEEAAKAYNIAALKNFGEYARINDIKA